MSGDAPEVAFTCKDVSCHTDVASLKGRTVPDCFDLQPLIGHLHDGGRNVTRKKKPPIYRVMLHNDSFNRREYVVSVLLKVVDGLAMDEAVNVMQVSTVSGRTP